MGGEKPEEALAGMDLRSWLDFDARDRTSSMLNALDTPGPVGTLSEERKSHNIMVMPFGEAAPFTVTKRYGQVWALGSEVRGDKVTRILEPMNAISGVTFYSGEALTSPSVSVEDGATIFRNCTFIKQSGHADVSGVSVTKSGYAIFVGCFFVREGAGTAPAVDNTNPVGASVVKIVGCLRTGFGSFGTTDPPVASVP